MSHLSDQIHNIKDALTGASDVPRPIELLRPSFYALLGIYYASILGYGLTACLFGIRTLILTNSSHFSFIWALVLGSSGLVAALGVWLSRRFKQEWIEVISTSLMIGLLVGYAVAILVRATTNYNALDTLPSVWLPIIIALLPGWRLAMIALEGHLFKKHRERRDHP